MAILQQSTSPAEHYSHLSDSEILQLAAEAHSLTPEAAGFLSGEMERRSLTERDVHDFNTSATTAGSTHSFANGVRLKARILLFACGHWIIGAYGSTFVVGTSIYGIRLVVEQFVPQWVWFTYSVLILPFFPLQTLTAFLCGFVLAREEGAFVRSRTALLAWVMPGLFLTSALLSYRDGSLLGETLWERFFWSSVLHTRLQQSDIGLPFLASVIYSIGHYVGSTGHYVGSTRRRCL